MILRPLNAAARLAIVFFALMLAIALGYSSIRNAVAAHDSNLETREARERAVRLEPGNGEDWYLLGRYWQYNMDEPDAPLAIKAYRTSLSLDPRSANTWLDLATAYESQGDLAAAREAFLQAKRVYPLSAEVAWRYGNFLLRQNEFPAAFAEIRQSVIVDPKRAAEALSRCWRVDSDIQAILNQVLPPSVPVYLDAIRELDADAAIDPALAVWDRLVALRSRLPLKELISFTDSLIQARRIDDARRVWDQAVALSDATFAEDAPGSVLWDGGFESGVAGGGFAWTFPSSTPGVQVTLDGNEKHSGQRSLRLGFDGLRNVNFSDVCHVVQILPGASYRFSGWVRTQGLTTDQGVRFRLEWLEGLHNASAETTDVHGTQPWTQINLPWTAAAGVNQLRVCVSRRPGDDMASRIHGTAWIDDVAVVPEPSTSQKTAASGKP
jgi:tetratricopeptide (TPR) repeat protein